MKTLPKQTATQESWKGHENDERKKNKVSLYDFNFPKTYYKAAVIKIVWY